MTNAIDERQRRASTANDLEADSDEDVAPAQTQFRREFSAAFDRCFPRVFAYVSRRVDDSKQCQRIVGEVLIENLDLLAGGADDESECCQLKASSDRLIRTESGSASAPLPLRAQS